MRPPFFQAAIAKSPQSNLYRHKTALRKIDPYKESVSTKLRNQKRCVHSIAGHRGERGISRKTIAQETPDCPVSLW
jgi:hypothetical protein